MMEVLKTILPDERHRVIELPVDSVKPNPYQPRRVFEPGALDELASSIIEFGVLQPISVRRIGSQYELIAGERRLRACKLVGLATIPAIIYNFKDDDSALLALLENLQREDLDVYKRQGKEADPIGAASFDNYFCTPRNSCGAF